MGAVVADTHALIWYLLDSRRLSADAARAFNEAASANDPIYLAAISVVEMIYLSEKGKLVPDALDQLHKTLDDTASGIRIVSLDYDIARAVQQVPRSLVPELPDRIIAATALHFKLPLITRDHKIRSAAIHTIW